MTQALIKSEELIPPVLQYLVDCGVEFTCRPMFGGVTMIEAQSDRRDVISALARFSSLSEPDPAVSWKGLPPLVRELWESHEASALTNRAARHIESLHHHLRSLVTLTEGDIPSVTVTSEVNEALEAICEN
tara:strand:- start:94621 stop:95013 length:393 start_codon:yes stop_codon:yes gene_type:complete